MCVYFLSLKDGKDKEILHICTMFILSLFVLLACVMGDIERKQKTGRSFDYKNLTLGVSAIMCMRHERQNTQYNKHQVPIG